MEIKDLTHVNSNELDYLKDNLCSFYTLPYRIDKFTFSAAMLPKYINVTSKNTYVGYLKIDNGLHPSSRNYYPIVEFWCTFFSDGRGTNIDGIRRLRVSSSDKLPSLDELVPVINEVLERFKNSF